MGRYPDGPSFADMRKLLGDETGGRVQEFERRQGRDRTAKGRGGPHAGEIHWDAVDSVGAYNAAINDPNVAENDPILNATLGLDKQKLLMGIQPLPPRDRAQIGKYKGKLYLIEWKTSGGKYKGIKNVYGEGDIIHIGNIESRRLALMNDIPPAIKKTLPNGRTLFWNLCVIFAGLKEPELKTGHKIVKITRERIHWCWVFWIDKKIVEFPDTVIKDPVGWVGMSFGFKHIAASLQALENMAKVEYYILSFATGGVKTMVKKAVKIGVRRIVLRSTSKVAKRMIIRVVKGVPKTLASATFKSSKDAVMEYLKESEPAIEKAALKKVLLAQKAVNEGKPRPPTALTKQEIEGVAMKSATLGVKKFITSMIANTFEAALTKHVDDVFADAMKKAETMGLMKQMKTSLQKHLTNDLTKLFTTDLAQVFIGSLLVASAAAVETGEWKRSVFHAEFRKNFIAESVKLFQGKIANVYKQPRDQLIEGIANDVIKTATTG